MYCGQYDAVHLAKDLWFFSCKWIGELKSTKSYKTSEGNIYNVYAIHLFLVIRGNLFINVPVQLWNVSKWYLICDYVLEF